MGFAVRFAWGIVGRPRERRFPMKFILCALCLVAMLGPVANLHAQVNPYKEGTPGVTGYRSEVLAEVTIQEDKFLRLAEAIPADKYTWRPAHDVRSFAEVFLHVSAANYNLFKLVGTPAPEGLSVKDLEKSTRLGDAGDLVDDRPREVLVDDVVAELEGLDLVAPDVRGVGEVPQVVLDEPQQRVGKD